MKWRSLTAGVLVLVALTTAAHLPSLRGGFIWDDEDHLTQNAAVTGPGGLRPIWSSLRVSRYYPLTLTTFWLEHRVWGLKPMPYHAVNVALQAANAVLLYFLLRRLQVRPAWVAAALWAVHPVSVESVAWVTELKNTQSAFFFFLTLLCYLRFEQRPKPGWFAAALVCFAAALLSKPSTVMLPLVLLLGAWWQRQRWTRADLLRAGPFFAMAAGMSLLTIAEQQLHIQREAQDWSLSFAQRLVVAGKDLWFYGAKLFWPRPLMFVYPRWQTDAAAVAAWVPALVVVLVGAVLWRTRPTRIGRAVVFGLGYFALSLVPVLGFFDVYYFRYSFVADHFQYLASIGPLALVAAAGAASGPRPALRNLAAGLAILGLGILTWQHSHTFRDNETLWRDTLAKNPGAAIAHNNLGTLLRAQTAPDPAHQRSQQAEAHLREALRLDPGSAQIRNNLGVMLAERGEYVTATVLFRQAVRLQPDYADARINLAGALARQGKLAEAIGEQHRVLVVTPNNGELHYQLALNLLAAGRTNEAIDHLRRTTELRPSFADGYQELGGQLARHGAPAQAIAIYRRGLAVLPQHLHLANQLAWSLATCPEPALRAPDEAIRIAERLVSQTKHRVPEPLATLAAAYAAAGRFSEAVRTAREALALAEAQAQQPLATAIRTRLQCYEQQRVPS